MADIYQFDIVETDLYKFEFDPPLEIWVTKYNNGTTAIRSELVGNFSVDTDDAPQEIALKIQELYESALGKKFDRLHPLFDFTKRCKRTFRTDVVLA